MATAGFRIASMSCAVDFRGLVSGHRQGLGAALMRAVLCVAEVPYAAVVRLRNRRYDTGRAVVHQAGVPVISVGNLTLGGTGKTPMVKWIARWLCNRGLRVVIISRGYGRTAADAHNDEAIELQQMLPGVPHLQDPDRVAAARAAIQKFAAQVILLDDGFQHRRLGRELDIVLLDALEPFGFGHVFPRGTLREPIESLRRADLMCLTRADMVDSAERQRIYSEAAAVAPGRVWCEVAHSPQALLSASGGVQSIGSLPGRRVAAFCGIGNPMGFKHTLSAVGCELVAWRTFADHHAYNAADIADLQSWAATCGADVAVCTHKDLVKLQVERLGPLPLFAVVVEMNMLTGERELEGSLLRTVSRIKS
jgi:tetraacyldisaccharide 4'-kinase